MQVEKRIHKHFASVRTYGKKKEFFALSVKQVDSFYARLAHELAGDSLNTSYQPNSSKKRKTEQNEILKAVLLEQAAQRAMLEQLIVRRF